MKHTAELTVRSYECDSYNHVNNSVYLNYLEFARMEFMHAINFYYKSSAFLDDVLEITTESSKLGKVSGEFKQVIAKKDGTVCAEATVSWACVTTEGRPSKIPENFLVSGLIPEKA